MKRATKRAVVKPLANRPKPYSIPKPKITRQDDTLAAITETLQNLRTEVFNLKKNVGAEMANLSANVNGIVNKCAMSLPICRTSGMFDHLKMIKDSYESKGFKPRYIFLSQVGVTPEVLKLIFEDPWFHGMELMHVAELKDGCFLIGGQR